MELYYIVKMYKNYNLKIILLAIIKVNLVGELYISRTMQVFMNFITIHF